MENLKYNCQNKIKNLIMQYEDLIGEIKTTMSELQISKKVQNDFIESRHLNETLQQFKQALKETEKTSTEEVVEYFSNNFFEDAYTTLEHIKTNVNTDLANIAGSVEKS